MNKTTIRPTLSRIALGAALAVAAGLAVAQPPGPVTGAVFTDPDTLGWNVSATADFYHVYRGSLDDLAGGEPARCHGFQIPVTSFASPDAPEQRGDSYFYLVTAEDATGGESSPGLDSEGRPRSVLGSCSGVMRNHVLGRTGYGWGEWSRDRIAMVGVDGYMTEQLDPASIDESTNDELNTRLALYDPPLDIVQLIARQIVQAVYARRQLEQQAATFWANHFNTDWSKIAEIYQGPYPQCQQPPLPQCDPNFPATAYLEASLAQLRELEDYRFLAFNGSFREMVEVSTLSPAMILYLDTYASIAGNPNENYPRELMELHTMGVAGGYTQLDVEELSRVITGWTICKKRVTALEPTDPCIEQYWLDSPPGEWVAHYYEPFHDCTEKTLFLGTDHQVTIQDTCANPADGVQDLFLALDAIVAHPSTPRFISGKILERFVTDEPTEEMIDALVAVWNDGTNPAGVGDMRAVLDAAVAISLDPDLVATKIKTPLEHLASSIRATRGRTDGVTGVINYLALSDHVPHYNPVPTGWPEDGGSWIATNDTLERQNFAILLQTPSANPAFGAEPGDLLADNGIPTAPGNAEAIVSFFADVLFGGALTAEQRQIAVDYLETDDLGAPAPYDDLRIREVVALLLGFPQFQEQ